MARLSQKLKKCSVKIATWVSGAPSYGSGVLYVNPNNCSYDYILTAKHIFQEDRYTPFNPNKVFNIEVLHSENRILKRLDYLNSQEVEERLLVFDEDFAIIVINKNRDISFPQILVSDDINDEDTDFFSWGIFSANTDQLQHFQLIINDIEMRRFQTTGNLDHKYLQGWSGAGVFHKNRSVLYGIVTSYPNDAFQNQTIDCSIISFTNVNHKLKSLNRIILETPTSSQKREINEEVISIHESVINDVVIDLEKARKRLKSDIEDDWYHDPLKYIDLLNQDYLFKQFESYFIGEEYHASEAEKFYVPKKQFTLRQALISPFIDRIMYMGTVGVIAEKLDAAMIPNVYSARYNSFSENQLILNGVEQWKKMEYKLSECAQSKKQDGEYLYGCVIEIDLLNFYDNINKKLLHEKIKRVCVTPNEKKAADLLHDIISSFSRKELGLPQNSEASSLLASFYLNQIDILIQHNSPAYYRFMDDIRIFCSNKYEARRILQLIESELRRCDLSVNSQKTKILSFISSDKKPKENEETTRESYDVVFDLEINKISRLRKSQNYEYLNDAFHLSVKVLQESLDESDPHESEKSSRRLNYTLNTIALLAKNKLNLSTKDSRLEKAIEVAINSLKDKPWITPQICKVLNLIPTEIVKMEFLEMIKEIVLNKQFNTYSFQTYQLWLLLAKHKCKSEDLRKYAVVQIEKNDDTNRAVIAAMTIYMCSIDLGYRRIILRKFGENFTKHYFQNRLALISLRSFSPDIVNYEYINQTLKNAPQFTYKYKNKDLVFVQGFDEDEDSENNFDQLYSI